MPTARKSNTKLLKKEWEIPRLTKNNLIIGDENLQRIEKIDNDDAHILSYPGLKFAKLSHVLRDRQEKVDKHIRDPIKNPSPGTIPQKIVFNIGSHDAAGGMLQISVEQSLRDLRKSMDQQFRSSQIYLCPISNDAAFNDYVAELCKKWENWTFLDTIVDVFETDPTNPIHWTPACAQKVADKIFDRLN